MILSTNFWSKNPETLTNRPYNYMVLDISHMADSDMLDMFEHSLNILNNRNAFEMVNHLWKDMGVKRKLDTTIFNTIMDAVYSQKPLKPELLKYYFSVMKEFEEVVKAFRAFNANLENIFIQDSIEFLLLGVSFGVQRANKEKIDSHEGISDRYTTAKYSFYNGNTNYKTFLSEAEKLFYELQEPGEKAA